MSRRSSECLFCSFIVKEASISRQTKYKIAQTNFLFVFVALLHAILSSMLSCPSRFNHQIDLVQRRSIHVPSQRILRMSKDSLRTDDERCSVLIAVDESLECLHDEFDRRETYFVEKTCFEGCSTVDAEDPSLCASQFLSVDAKAVGGKQRYSLTRLGQIALIVIPSFAYLLAEDLANDTIPAFAAQYNGIL